MGEVRHGGWVGVKRGGWGVGNRGPTGNNRPVVGRP